MGVDARALLLLAVTASCFEVIDGGGSRRRAARSLYPSGKSAVEELGNEGLADVVTHATDGPFTTLVEFYAPWCPHCQHFAPSYERVAEHFVGDQRVRVTAVDCVAHSDLCKQNKVHSYPTLKVFHVPGEVVSFQQQGLVLKIGHARALRLPISPEADQDRI